MAFALMLFPILSLDCAMELAMSGIILERADHIVEVNEGGR